MTSARQEQRTEPADAHGRTAESPEVTEDAVFEALGNVRRRYVLRALSTEEDSFEIGPLAERVAARENETTPEQVSSSQRKSTYTSLHQLHLPKLEALGFLEYDRRRGEIRPKPALTVVEPYLCDQEPGFPWSTYYLSFSAVMGTAVALAWLSVFPFSAVAHIGWAGVTVGLLALSALVHRRDQRNS